MLWGKPSPWLLHSVRSGSKALTRQAALLEIKEAAVAAGLPSPDRASSPEPESSSRAYYVITEFVFRGTPVRLTRAKCLRYIVSALGLEPRTL